MSFNRIDGASEGDFSGDVTVSGKITTEDNIQTSKNITGFDVIATNTMSTPKINTAVIRPGSYEITFPALSPAIDQYLVSDASGNLAWEPIVTSAVAFSFKIQDTPADLILTTRDDGITELSKTLPGGIATSASRYNILKVSPSQFEIPGYNVDTIYPIFKVANTTTQTAQDINTIFDTQTALTATTQIFAGVGVISQTHLYYIEVSPATTGTVTINLTAASTVGGNPYSSSSNAQTVNFVAGTPVKLYFGKDTPYIPAGAVVAITISTTGSISLRTQSGWSDPNWTLNGDWGGAFPWLRIYTGPMRADATIQGNLILGNPNYKGSATLRFPTDSDVSYGITYPATNPSSTGLVQQTIDTNGTTAWRAGLPINIATAGFLNNDGSGNYSWTSPYPANASGVLTNNGTGTLSWNAISSSALTSTTGSTTVIEVPGGGIAQIRKTNQLNPGNGDANTIMFRATESGIEVPGPYYPTHGNQFKISAATSAETTIIKDPPFNVQDNILSGSFANGLEIKILGTDPGLLNKTIKSLTLTSYSTSTVDFYIELSQISNFVPGVVESYDVDTVYTEDFLNVNYIYGVPILFTFGSGTNRVGSIPTITDSTKALRIRIYGSLDFSYVGWKEDSPNPIVPKYPYNIYYYIINHGAIFEGPRDVVPIMTYTADNYQTLIQTAFTNSIENTTWTLPIDSVLDLNTVNAEFRIRGSDPNIINKSISTFSIKPTESGFSTFKIELALMTGFGSTSMAGQYIAFNNSGDIYYSSDYGANFTIVYSGVANGEVAISDNGAYLVTHNGINEVYISTNGGINWTTHIFDGSNSNPETLGEINGLSISQDGQYISFIGNDSIIRTTNAGANWILGVNGVNGADMYMSPTGQYQIGIFRNVGIPTIFKSTDYGANWTDITSNIPGSIFYSCAISYDGNLIVIVRNDAILISVNGGSSFTVALTVSLNESNCAITPDGQKIIVGLWLGTSTVAYYSVDYGVTWNSRTVGGFSSGSVDVDAAGNFYVSHLNGINNGVYKSTNNGASWNILSGTTGLGASGNSPRILSVSRGFSPIGIASSFYTELFPNKSYQANEMLNFIFGTGTEITGTIPKITSMSNNYRIRISSQIASILCAALNDPGYPYNSYYYFDINATPMGVVPLGSYGSGIAKSMISGFNQLQFKSQIGTDAVKLITPDNSNNYKLTLPSVAPGDNNTHDLVPRTLVSGNTGLLSWRDHPVLVARGIISSAQILGMWATPVQLVAAPGFADTIIVPDFLILNFVYGTVAYTAGGNIGLRYGNTGSISALPNAISASFINDTQNGFATLWNGAIALNGSNTSYFNKGLFLTNETSSFATGDGTLLYEIHYRVISQLL